ncbi:hypothetical protein [Halorarum halobium]|uniref:hypothetical protein n=1 Tax=Halorarum halobium TaxID=3075121 RepID=UPI0028B102BB|nr:hypothetical protein [Halobaculum sp. XH14]
MVGPSMTEEDRRLASRRLKGGFVLLVGASAALVSLQADASLVQTAVAVVVALVVGVALLWFVLRLLRELQPPERRPPPR